MIIRIPGIIFLMLLSLSSICQQRAGYVFLQDDSLLQRKYYAISMAKKAALLSAADKKYTKDYKRIYEDQFTEIGELWLSRRPVTNPEVHAYLNGIVQKITSHSPELAGNDARVVFTRDWWPNASSLGDGSITINAGLITNLDNEAEIAFVVCHELAHYYLEHTPKSIRKLVEMQNSEEFLDAVKRLNREQYRVNEQYTELLRTVSFSSRRHSRGNETEADRYAFHFFRNSGYNSAGIESCLTKLDHIDETVFASPMDFERVFNFTSFPFNQRWIREESSIFSAMKDGSSPLTKAEKDSMKTHPDCLQRIASLRDSIDLLAGKGSNFLVDSIRFRALKNDFHLEIMEQCYRDKNPGRNLYYALTYLRTHPDEPVAVYSIGRALNELYVLQRDHLPGFTMDLENRAYPAEYNRLLKMFRRIRLQELGDLAYYFIRQYQPVMKDYPGYDALLKIAQSYKQ